MSLRDSKRIFVVAEFLNRQSHKYLQSVRLYEFHFGKTISKPEMYPGERLRITPRYSPCGPLPWSTSLGKFLADVLSPAIRLGSLGAIGQLATTASDKRWHRQAAEDHDELAVTKRVFRPPRDDIQRALSEDDHLYFRTLEYFQLSLL